MDLLKADELWQQSTIAGLGLNALFTAGDVEFRVVRDRPSATEVAHAVANVQAWRSYLPKVCVTEMIREGWQWST